MLDRPRGLVVTVDVDIVLQAATRRYDAEDAQGGVHQLASGLDDSVQDDGQLMVTHDEAIGPQEATQPSLRRQNVLRSVDQLRQQLIELEPRPTKGHCVHFEERVGTRGLHQPQP